MRLVFIAGPYRATARWETEQNVRKAEAAGVEVARMGLFPVIPHANTRPYFEGLCPDEFWLEGTQALLVRCDMVLAIEGWDKSVGANKEVILALQHNIPVYYSLDELRGGAVEQALGVER